MARSIWNGVISFGLVSIPVRLFPATSEKDISFNELHEPCKSRLKRIRWCPFHNKEVTADEVIKGYEYAKGQYVEMQEEDFEKLPIPSKHTIEVSAFVESTEIDPVYYDTTYSLEPDEAGKKPFALFLHALKGEGKSAIGTVTIRKKEQLCSLRLAGGNLMLDTLYYQDEVRVELDKEIPEVKLTDQEEKMAKLLVDALSDSFKPGEYKDTYREALLQVIEAKLEGRQVVEAPAAEETKVTDLMEALRASVEAAKKRKAS